MLLIPYFWDTTQSKKRLGVFLSEGGNSLWNLDDTETHDSIIALLEDNEFPVTDLTYANGAVYALIDYSQISLRDFYLSTDPSVSDKDVWQIFDIPTIVLTSEEFKSVCQMLTGVSGTTLEG